MGHVRLGLLPQSRKWREVVALLETGGSVAEIARASANAAEHAFSGAASDPIFQYVARLLVELPLAARTPGFEGALETLGLDPEAPRSVADLTAAVTEAVDRQARRLRQRSDLGELAQMALIESLSSTLAVQLPSLFAPEPKEIRSALGQLSSGKRFGGFARSFFARLIHRSLDYYLSRELSNHVGPNARFGSDADRVAFDRALSVHAFETARIVEDFAGGWYGKTIWQKDGLTAQEIDKFARFAFKKVRDELGRRREVA